MHVNKCSFFYKLLIYKKIFPFIVLNRRVATSFDVDDRRSEVRFPGGGGGGDIFFATSSRPAQGKPNALFNRKLR
jgi:hypothetical protein